MRTLPLILLVHVLTSSLDLCISIHVHATTYLVCCYANPDLVTVLVTVPVTVMTRRRNTALTRTPCYP